MRLRMQKKLPAIKTSHTYYLPLLVCFEPLIKPFVQKVCLTPSPGTLREMTQFSDNNSIYQDFPQREGAVITDAQSLQIY